MNEIDIFKDLDSFMFPTTLVIAYRIKNTLGRIEDAFQECCKPDVAHFDLSILRLPEKRLKIKDVGCQLHYDPVTGDDIEEFFAECEVPKSRIKNGYIFTSGASYTPLSDIYCRMVQNGYYSLGDRNFSATDIGRHVMEYMNWSSASWEDIYD